MEKFLEIQDCITLCKFQEAKKFLEEHEVRSSTEGLQLKLLSLQQKVKEQEHKNIFQQVFLDQCLQEYLALFAESQVLDLCLDSLHLQLQCCSNILSLLISNPAKCHHDSSFLQYFLLYLEYFCQMFWNETSAFPANHKSFSSKKHVAVKELIQHIASSLNFVCMILKNLADTCLFFYLLSLLLDFVFWLFRRNQEERIIAQILNQISGIINGNKIWMKTKRLDFLDLRFNKRSTQDIQQDWEVLTALHSLWHRSRRSYMVINDYKKTSLKEFNCLSFVLKGIYLYSMQDYESCYAHINELLKFSVYTSQLSMIQLSLVQSLNTVCTLYLKGRCEIAEEIISTPCSSLDCFQATFILNKIALHGITNDTDKCINLLYNALKNRKKTELPFLVSNFQHLVDVFLLKNLNKSCPPIPYKGWFLFLHASVVPKVYVYQKLATLLFKEKRYAEAYENFQAASNIQNGYTITGENNICNFTSSHIDFASFYRNFCFCCMALRRFQESLDILTNLKDKGLSNIWMLVYEAEIHRHFKNFEVAMDLLKRALLLSKHAKNVDESKNEENNSEGEKRFKKCHVLNNLGVLQIIAGDTMNGFTYIKHAMKECHRLGDIVFPELVYNYCKWLHDNKTKEMAEVNWKSFYHSEVAPNFAETYKCLL